LTTTSKTKSEIYASDHVSPWKNMTSLEATLEEFAHSLSLDLFGVADLTPARSFVSVQRGEHIARFPRAISIGIRLLDPIVDELHQHENRSVIYAYRRLYNSVNANLDRTAHYCWRKRYRMMGSRLTQYLRRKPSTRSNSKGSSRTSWRQTSRVTDG